MAKYEARVAPWKRQEVRQLTKLLKESPVVGVAQVDKLPSKQFQDIRGKVRDSATIRVSKNSLLMLALEELDGDLENIDELEDHIEGQIAIILTDTNPFTLFKTIEGSKANAPAKPGDLAPKNIVVEKGDTPFAPGPVVGDLQKAGLPAKIEGGKVIIAKTSTVVEQGEPISADLASALTRLEIHPMIVGLDLKAVWEDGTVFDREALDIDQDAILGDLVNAHARAQALAIEVGFPTASTLPMTIGKAVREARALALEAAILEPSIVDEILARGHAHAAGLADSVGYEPGAPAEPASKPETEESEKSEESEDEPADAEEAEADEADADEAEADEADAEEAEADEAEADEADAKEAEADEAEEAEAEDAEADEEETTDDGEAEEPAKPDE